MKRLAIIPARGGSKRLPGKNIKKLNGVPLVSYTIQAAINSRCFNDIILSSDDDDILSCGKEYRDVTPLKRASHLASDHATVWETVRDICMDDRYNGKYRMVVLLLPVCPFRDAEHIRGALACMSERVDGVVSVTQFSKPPQLGMRIDDNNGEIIPFMSPSPLITGETRSQDQYPVYHANGGIYIKWWHTFLEHGNFFKGNVKAYPMPHLSSIDIDDIDDFMFAEYLLKNHLITINKI